MPRQFHPVVRSRSPPPPPTPEDIARRESDRQAAAAAVLAASQAADAAAAAAAVAAAEFHNRPRICTGRNGPLSSPRGFRAQCIGRCSDCGAPLLQGLVHCDPGTSGSYGCWICQQNVSPTVFCSRRCRAVQDDDEMED